MLWILRPVKSWEPWYDKSNGFVVRADSEADARRLASADAGDEGIEAWLDAAKTTCVELLASGTSEVVICDFMGA